MLFLIYCRKPLLVSDFALYLLYVFFPMLFHYSCVIHQFWCIYPCIPPPHSLLVCLCPCCFLVCSGFFFCCFLGGGFSFTCPFVACISIFLHFSFVNNDHLFFYNLAASVSCVWILLQKHNSSFFLLPKSVH